MRTTSSSRYWVAALCGLALLTLGSRHAHADALALGIDLTTVPPSQTISIQATPLAPDVFPGKNMAIPVTIRTGRPLFKGEKLQVEMLYQLVDGSGQAVGGLASAPVTLTPTVQDNKTFAGVAIVPRRELAAIRQHGKVQYYFRGVQGARSSYLMRAPSGGVVQSTSPLTNLPFESHFISTMRAAVSNQGSVVVAPDTMQTDGKTTISLAPGAVSGPGDLVLQQEDPNLTPPGPGNTKPVVVYSMALAGTSLQRSAILSLSYPANPDGSVGDDRFNPLDLAMYSYASGVGWQLVGRPTTDTTLHTVAGQTTQLNMFALFPTGPVGAADLRPMRKILTPNGDGINDTVTFTGLSDNETVKIYDLKGRRVRTIHGPPHVWDGRDDSGAIVESGPYLYQYTSQGDRVSGLVMVAK